MFKSEVTIGVGVISGGGVITEGGVTFAATVAVVLSLMYREI